MQPVFLILGYGVPDDIRRDENYQLYLKVAFNKIWARSRPGDRVVVVMCGGPTDMREPYTRTEAAEMVRAFRVLMDRESVKLRTQHWELVAEDRSLSTLENLLLAKEQILERAIEVAKLTIIAETTRRSRIEELAGRVFGEVETDVVTVDFDQSVNRYLDPAFIAAKEQKVLELDRWALEDPARMKKHHEVYEEKLRVLREAGPEHHAEAVKAFWEAKLKEFGNSAANE